MENTDLIETKFDLGFSIKFEKLKTCPFCTNTTVKMKHTPRDCLMGFLFLHISRQRPLTYSPETNKNHKQEVIELFNHINDIRLEAGLKSFS